MSHRVHPKAFRLRDTTDWDSRGFYKKSFPEYLEEDFSIRRFLEKRLKDAGVQNVEIERFPGKVNVIINTARPGLIIGRGGAGIEDIKRDLGKILEKYQSRIPGVNKAGWKREMKIEIREIRDPWTRASLAAQYIVQMLEKRMPHRRVIKQSMDKIMAYKGVEGARIEVAGRLGGSEIARREWLQKGRLPRQTIRADIDYIHWEAHCAYGVIGVKVWIYKGEKFE